MIALSELIMVLAITITITAMMVIMITRQKNVVMTNKGDADDWKIGKKDDEETCFTTTSPILFEQALARTSHSFV